ncbi:hypothetical protein [Lederbergia lenta]|uniref:Uncharacterized protein n=1 Tax=Lederbergia lenta TaxID=1467 RepID=A0A2X4VS75_LEDLE|nr:hypothetical protein [Lederbergia lenta]MCM3110779.1 hypothetical protein [Lederbergia lenta]MEC2325826.1 hypothetical protein [Lederbergia lenta]SQI53691.1 Uncharacterised protein [Lederbergia lenta]
MLKNNNDTLMTEEMLINYYELNKKKKEIETEMNHLKRIFHEFFDNQIGTSDKGEITLNGYKLQRQIRKTEKFDDEATINKLEELKMNDLIQIIKKPDALKIKSAINLGFLDAKDLDGCIITTSSPAISVKPIVPR